MFIYTHTLQVKEDGSLVLKRSVIKVTTLCGLLAVDSFFNNSLNESISDRILQIRHT